MLVFLGEDYSTRGLSPEDMQQRMGKWFAWGQKMQEAGVKIDGHALDSDTVRYVSGPDRTVTDRAGSEIKELVGGYYIVTALDLDGAMEIAAGYPDYDHAISLVTNEVEKLYLTKKRSHL